MRPSCSRRHGEMVMKRNIFYERLVLLVHMSILINWCTGSMKKIVSVYTLVSLALEELIRNPCIITQMSFPAKMLSTVEIVQKRPGIFHQFPLSVD